MLSIKRKNRYSEFPLRSKLLNLLLLILLFGSGFFISYREGFIGISLYLILWILSYVVIYAGTCRNCEYYGKSCPIPLEGGCVHKFFKKSDRRFGYISLLWAAISYTMRTLIPIIIIIRGGLIYPGAGYIAIFLIFGITHLLYTGCPNCINTDCPVNPEFIKE